MGRHNPTTCLGIEVNKIPPSSRTPQYFLSFFDCLTCGNFIKIASLTLILHLMQRFQNLLIGLLTLCAAALTAEDIELANGTILQNAKILSATHESLNIFHDGQIRTIASEHLSNKDRKSHLTEKVENATNSPTNLGQRPVLEGERLFLNAGDRNPVIKALSSLPSTVIAEAGDWKMVSIEVWVNDNPESPLTRRSTPSPASLSPSKSKIELVDWKWVFKSDYITIDGVIKNTSGGDIGRIKLIMEVYGDGKYLGSGYCYSDRNGISNGGTSPFSLAIWDVQNQPSNLKISYTFEY
jgi:hypothetical protein